MGKLEHLNPIRKDSRFHQGYHKLTNPQKLIGHYNEKMGVMFRSGLELRFIKLLDTSPRCVRWTYESDELVISYFNPVKKKICKYYPDFYVEMVGNSGKLLKYIFGV